MQILNESFAYPADGESVFRDRRMPYAWQASSARLYLITALGEAKVADLSQNPHMLVRGSTAADGVTANVLSEAEFLSGADATGALVVLEPWTEPRGVILTAILDRGGIGLVTDFSADPFATPDAVPNVTGCCENDNFAPDCETRPFVAFAVSPRNGMRLRNLVAAGGLRARVYSDGRREVGTVRVDTEFLAGRDRAEIWLVVDRSAVGAEAARTAAQAALERLAAAGMPRFGVRLVMADDRAALDAHVAQHAAAIRDTVICAGSCRDLSLAADHKAAARCSGAFSPSYANVALFLAVSEFNGRTSGPHLSLQENLGHVDDLFLSDPATGVPTVGLVPDVIDSWLRYVTEPTAAGLGRGADGLVGWMTQRVAKGMDAETMVFWKNVWDAHLADGARFADATAVAAARARLDSGTRPYRLSCRPPRPAPTSAWRDYAAGVVLARIPGTVPQGLVKIPPAERPHFLKPVSESPVADVLAALDGRRDLAQAIRVAELARGSRFDELSVARCVRFFCRLSEVGYLTGTNRNAVTQSAVVAALRAVGVASGDVLLVHSALAAFGHVVGGARTLLAALREAVGETGTVLLPAFATSFRVLDVSNKMPAFRPFDPKDPTQVAWVGQLPVTFLRDHPDAPHSGHCTNAWTGFGPKAAELLSGHPFDDGPASERSPLAKALAAKGKVVFLGADVKSCSFLHYLEDQFDLSGVAPALVSVKGADGRPHDVAIARHVPGPRAFYKLGEEAPFFRAAKARGLEIRRATLGLGTVKAMDLETLARVGRELLRDDPTLLGREFPKPEKIGGR